MALIKLYIATSIDGYIARKNNSIDFLEHLENPNNIDHGYFAFYAETDVVVLGRKTYEEVLGFDVDWPYPDCKTYVATSNKDYEVKTPNTHLLNNINTESIHQLKAESNKNIWLIGGGNIITSFLNLDAVDEMTITIIPTILGEGLPLFPNQPKETRFSLISAEGFETGAVNLNYKRK